MDADRARGLRTGRASSPTTTSELTRASRAERKGIKRLLKSIGAVPTAPGRDGGEDPAGNDAQDA